MDSKAFDALLGYKSAMAQAHIMQKRGLISDDEFTRIEAKMCEIYCINFDSLYREINWINTSFRANMNMRKGVE